MLTTNTQHLYQLQPQDFIINNNDSWSLSLPPWLECSIIQNHHLIIPNQISLSNDNTRKLISLPPMDNNNPYFLAVHIPKKGIKGPVNYNAFHSIQLLMNIFSTKKSLLNHHINPKQQNPYQNIDIPLPQDNSYVFIKIADKLVYSINPDDIIISPVYLPKYNQPLQNILIKIKPDTISKWDNMILSPPIALDLILFDPITNNHYIRITSKVLINNNQEYNNDFGYLYATFYNDNNFIWRNSINDYYLDMEYIIQWNLSQNNINTLINIQNNQQQIYFKCRYAIDTYNENYIWRKFINPIPIKINTPPPAPINLQLKAR